MANLFRGKHHINLSTKMKKLTLLFLFLSSFAFGQFTVTTEKWNEVGKYLNAIKLYQNEDKSKAKLWYLDYNSVLRQNVFSPTMDYEFEFATDPDTLDKIYNIIKEKLEKQEEEVVVLNFPEGTMKLSFFKALGKVYMNFKFENSSVILDKNSTSERESYGLNLKRLNQLFGK